MKAIKPSTRTRFEIFKRDAFTCQYCGRKPPTVVLHVDHIIAVANGGDAARENLITSCADCNLGKSCVPLDSVTKPIEKAIEEAKERRAQVNQYNKWLRQLRAASDAEFKSISDAIISAEGVDPEEWRIANHRERSVRCLLGRLPSEMIIDAVGIADRFNPWRFKEQKTFKYFCGVCWRMVDRAEGKEIPCP